MRHGHGLRQCNASSYNLVAFCCHFTCSVKDGLAGVTGRAGTVMKGNCGASEFHCLELFGFSKNLINKFCAITTFF